LTCAPQQIERLEFRDLERAIMSLSEEQRTAVLLIGLTPANYKEVASASGVPVGTIRSRASRGRTTLRKLMGIAHSQRSRASRPLRLTAAATVDLEKDPPVDYPVRYQPGGRRSSSVFPALSQPLKGARCSSVNASSAALITADYDVRQITRKISVSAARRAGPNTTGCVVLRQIGTRHRLISGLHRSIFPRQRGSS
jgi:Sigma-70, region 4